jgi:hypothetical protein
MEVDGQQPLHDVSCCPERDLDLIIIFSHQHHVVL